MYWSFVGRLQQTLSTPLNSEESIEAPWAHSKLPLNLLDELSTLPKPEGLFNDQAHLGAPVELIDEHQGSSKTPKDPFTTSQPASEPRGTSPRTSKPPRGSEESLSDPSARISEAP